MHNKHSSCEPHSSLSFLFPLVCDKKFTLSLLNISSMLQDFFLVDHKIVYRELLKIWLKHVDVDLCVYSTVFGIIESLRYIHLCNLLKC